MPLAKLLSSNSQNRMLKCLPRNSIILCSKKIGFHCTAKLYNYRVSPEKGYSFAINAVVHLDTLLERSAKSQRLLDQNTYTKKKFYWWQFLRSSLLHRWFLFCFMWNHRKWAGAYRKIPTTGVTTVAAPDELKLYTSCMHHCFCDPR
jgi:hypothetical protein